MIKVKRVYDPADSSDGHRILVERLWPRGVSKEKAAIEAWRRDLAPSDDLRRWFGHDPRKWVEFKNRYREELQEAGKTEELKQLRRQGQREDVTLIFSAREVEHNNAVALKEFIDAAD